MGRVRVRDFYSLAKALEALGKEVEAKAERAMYRTAVWGVREARVVSGETDPRPKASGDYEAGFRAQRIRGGGRLYNKTPYARWVERGRKPGKQPPIEPIVKWIKRKGIARRLSRGVAKQDKEIRGMAFAIARKIGRKGIPGRYVMDRTMRRVKRKAKDELKAMISRIAARPPTR